MKNFNERSKHILNLDLNIFDINEKIKKKELDGKIERVNKTIITDRPAYSELSASHFSVEIPGLGASCRVDAEAQENRARWIAQIRVLYIHAVEGWSASRWNGQNWTMPGRCCSFRREIPDTRTPAFDPGFAARFAGTCGLGIHRYVTEIPAVWYAYSRLSSHYFRSICSGTDHDFFAFTVNGQLDVDFLSCASYRHLYSVFKHFYRALKRGRNG